MYRQSEVESDDESDENSYEKKRTRNIMYNKRVLKEIMNMDEVKAVCK